MVEPFVLAGTLTFFLRFNQITNMLFKSLMFLAVVSMSLANCGYGGMGYGYGGGYGGGLNGLGGGLDISYICSVDPTICEWVPPSDRDCDPLTNMKYSVPGQPCSPVRVSPLVFLIGETGGYGGGFY